MREKAKELLLITALVAAIALPGAAFATPRDDMPRDAVAAMELYESDPDRWAEGPVRYVLLDSERAVLDELETTAQRAQFIKWFWDRRDNELADTANPARLGFYKRVAEANRKYNDFPRGWKSIRGEIHIVLGRPDSVRPSMGNRIDSTVWTYYTVGPEPIDASFGSVSGEIAIAFVKQRQRAGYQIYGGFGGPGTLPLYVRDALNYSKLAAVVDPYLKGTFGN
jgi:GWxTD domain-containing protein